MSRKDLERTQVSIGKLKNPQPEFGVVREKQQFMPKMESKPIACLLYTSPSPRDRTRSRMPSSA